MTTSVALAERVPALAALSAKRDLTAFIGRLDHVTLLPNRLQFLDDFAAGTNGSGDAVLVLVTIADARRFNELLRALGHAFAEDFIRAAARRIRGIRPAEAPLYHVSVLSFAMMIEPDGTEPPEPVRALLDAFALPVMVQDVPISSRVSVGLHRCDAASDASANLRAALAAAQDGRASPQRWSHYDARSDGAHRRAFTLLNDLRSAIGARDQLSLRYQPRVNLRTRGMGGAEVLLRWNHPTLGTISPAEFIPLVETTGLIEPLTIWVLETAARQSAAWRAAGLDVKLSANVSPGTLAQMDLAACIAAILDAARVPPGRFEVELTEGVLASADTGVLRQMAQLRKDGVSIAIDDFGTGYSNMSYLTQLPADVIKIDKSLVQGIDAEPRQGVLVRAIIDLSHDLGFSVVAEGIETPVVYGLLREWGCDEGQGFHMSHPLAAADFARWAPAR